MNDQRKAPQAAKQGGREKNINCKGDTITSPYTVSPLEAAKASVTIADAWRILGLPGTPSTSCRSPWREDRKPSFSVFDSARRFKDHATNECGDVVTFVSKAAGKTLSEAAKMVIAWAGTGGMGGARTLNMRPMPIPPRATERREKPELPALRKPSPEELVAIGKQRKLPETYGGYPGLEIAVQRGLLWVTNVYDHGLKRELPAWVATDSSRWNAQARRMDGQPWHLSSGAEAKAKTLPGSLASWPIGAADIGNAKVVLMLEGPPDLLAAMTAVFLSFSQDLVRTNAVAFVCVAGASNQLHPDSMPCFKGRHVRVIPHLDSSGVGTDAAESWATQLAKAGAKVDWFDLQGLGKPGGLTGKDLNDALYWETDDGWNEPQLPAWCSELAWIMDQKSEVVA